MSDPKIPLWRRAVSRPGFAGTFTGVGLTCVYFGVAWSQPTRIWVGVGLIAVAVVLCVIEYRIDQRRQDEEMRARIERMEARDE